MIYLYTDPRRRPCMTERFLARHGIEHTVVDVTTDPQSLEMISSWGYRDLPVVETPTNHWSGYDPDQLATLIGAGL